MGTWIKVKYGTHRNMEEALGLGRNTVNRWYNTDPKRFLMYLPQMSATSDTDAKDLMAMIEQRVEDVRCLKGVS